MKGATSHYVRAPWLRNSPRPISSPEAQQVRREGCRQLPVAVGQVWAIAARRGRSRLSHNKGPARLAQAELHAALPRPSTINPTHPLTTRQGSWNHWARALTYEHPARLAQAKLHALALELHQPLIQALPPGVLGCVEARVPEWARVG